MITASHNQVSDNGIKIADPTGGMLSQDWEPFADAIANAVEPNDLIRLVTEFVKKEDIPIGRIQSAKIYLGRDTRPSGEVLLKAAKQGLALDSVLYIKRILGDAAEHAHSLRNPLMVTTLELEQYMKPFSVFQVEPPIDHRKNKASNAMNRDAEQ
ncbi:hypothetical protein IFM89_038949 [Coptis chinensis]|uniref:Alpha-D-phosphohexomutase alpha/beta/alpha domain-containing protein n=1 Tax=Coptis chinensis TaxID=261450 RepID=A0A835IZ27_9MAGN|nr:hypothetical protein IFM89_038949 [Coptis chinensis]